MKFPDLKSLIIFENEDILVLNKPPFISTLDDRSGDTVTVIKLLKDVFPDAQICHRLDKETSGALIVAKTPETYRFISMQFEHRQVNKVYHALIDGHHRFENLSVNLPILNLGKSNVKIDRKEGKNALTLFNSIRYYKHYTLVECRPITGRMHQIRIHLASQRASIAGDEMYGGKPVFLSKIKRGYKLSKNEEEQPMMKRFALHAKELSFQLPDNTGITVEAAYSKDYETLLKMLDKFDTLN